MTAVDRSARVIGLPDGAVVPYDILVLTPGLTEPTAARLGFPDPNAAPLSLHFLSHPAACVVLDDVASRGADRDPTGRDVIVYGAGLEALTAIAALIDRGIAPSRITFVTKSQSPSLPNLLPLPSPSPEASSVFASLSSRALKSLQEAGISVLSGYTLARVDRPTDASAVAVLKNTATDSTLEMQAAFIVCGDTRDADWRFFKAVNDSGLAYDGRLVVDNQWRTTDPNIYSAGPVTKFSRRYRFPTRLQHFNSLEMGAGLAGSVLTRVDPLLAGVETDAGTKSVPVLVLPKLTSAVLPAGLHYTHIALGGYTPAPASAAATDADGKATLLIQDVYGRLASLTYLGPEPVEARNLASLVGKVDSQLNGAFRLHKEGTVTDFIQYFRMDWSGALYHDRFPSLCRSIKQALKGDDAVRVLLDKLASSAKAGASDAAVVGRRGDLIGIAGSGLPPSTRRLIEMQLIDHLRVHGSMLPMYFVPGHTFK